MAEGVADFFMTFGSQHAGTGVRIADGAVADRRNHPDIFQPRPGNDTANVRQYPTVIGHAYFSRAHKQVFLRVNVDQYPLASKCNHGPDHGRPLTFFLVVRCFWYDFPERRFSSFPIDPKRP